MAAKEAMLGQLDMLKAKYDEAVDARKKTEHDIETVRPVTVESLFTFSNLLLGFK